MPQVGRGLDLAEEPLGTEGMSQFGTQHLQRDAPLVPEVLGQVHRRHPAGAKRALEAVPVGEGGRELRGDVGHRGVR